MDLEQQASELLAHARDATALASLARSDEERRLFLDIAEVWRGLAESASAPDDTAPPLATT